jgi:hypothetical protein
VEKKLAAVPVKLSPISLTMQPAAKIEWINVAVQNGVAP